MEAEWRRAGRREVGVVGVGTVSGGVEWVVVGIGYGAIMGRVEWVVVGVGGEGWERRGKVD